MFFFARNNFEERCLSSFRNLMAINRHTILQKPTHPWLVLLGFTKLQNWGGGSFMHLVYRKDHIMSWSKKNHTTSCTWSLLKRFVFINTSICSQLFSRHREQIMTLRLGCTCTMVVTQSRNILICLFVCVVFHLVVWLSFQTVCTKVRVVQEVASQLYSDVMGSNPILR